MPNNPNLARRAGSKLVREQAAAAAFNRPHPADVDNGDEVQLPNPPNAPLGPLDPTFIGNHSKSLPHSGLADPRPGEVEPGAYATLLSALASGEAADFERIRLAPNARRLINPQSGLAFDLEGPDAQEPTLPPAPKFVSDELAAEAAEVWWMAALRDVPFASYTTDPGAAEAARSLSAPGGIANGEFTVATSPRNNNGVVTRKNLFRGTLRGDRRGPYLSQFLLQGTQAPTGSRADGLIAYGAQVISQKIRTVDPNFDFLISEGDWLASQNGQMPPNAPPPDGTPRFLRNLRDLAYYVRADRNYQHYLNAALILQDVDHRGRTVSDRNPTPPRHPRDGTDRGNPYHDPNFPPPAAEPQPLFTSRTQEGFATFGDWHLLALLAEVTTRALKAAWYQKWFVHRRMRPEEYGGRVHFHFTRNLYQNLIHPEFRSSLNGGRLSNYYGPGKQFGTRLLPQAFPEGSPTHPAYPSGHAVVAGACVTVLKAWFDDQQRLNFFLPRIYQANPADGGQTLADIGPTPDEVTIGDELNKLASNISLGRNGAGVHWRSDYLQGVHLGEEVAIGLLAEQSPTYNEPHSFTLRSFRGPTLRVNPSGVTVV